MNSTKWALIHTNPAILMDWSQLYVEGEGSDYITIIFTSKYLGFCELFWFQKFISQNPRNLLVNIIVI